MTALVKRLLPRKAKTSIKTAGTVFNYLRSSGRVKALARLSMLSEQNLDQYAVSQCPICGSDDYHPLARIPVGYPGDQHESFFYFDYKSVEPSLILPMRHQLDKNLGFVLSVPWSFCNRCHNASLAVVMDQEHLNTYYSSYYIRSVPVHVNRRATKELHGRYLCQFLRAGSRVLEIGSAEGFAAGYVASQGHEVTVYEASANYQEQLDSGPGTTQISTLSTVEEDSLDAIVLHHVFEHIGSPIEYARSLHGLLKTNGLLFIQVPDVSLEITQYTQHLRRSAYSFLNPPAIFKEHIEYDFWSLKNYYPWLGSIIDSHVSAFTPEGLRYVTGQSGFEVEQLIQSTADRVTWDPKRYAWPADLDTGNTPNSLSLIARKQSAVPPTP